ncbi:MAG: hypothetical protein AAFX93_14765 [Verrucomicrobiota bacterium]
MKNQFLRLSLASGIVISALFTGCHSVQDFEYKGESYDTLNALSIDNRRPHAIERDAWRLDVTREAFIDDEEVFMGASADGAIIRFRVAFYIAGKKSGENRVATVRSVKVLESMEADLNERGFTIDNLEAVVDMVDHPYDAVWPLGDPIGYPVGTDPRISGFYIFSQPGAYDALLEVLASKGELEDPNKPAPQPVETGIEEPGAEDDDGEPLIRLHDLDIRWH